MTKDIASIQYYSLSTAGVFTSSWVVFPFSHFSDFLSFLLHFFSFWADGKSIVVISKGGILSVWERQFLALSVPSQNQKAALKSFFGHALPSQKNGMSHKIIFTQNIILFKAKNRDRTLPEFEIKDSGIFSSHRNCWVYDSVTLLAVLVPQYR